MLLYTCLISIVEVYSKLYIEHSSVPDLANRVPDDVGRS